MSGSQMAESGAGLVRCGSLFPVLHFEMFSQTEETNEEIGDNSDPHKPGTFRKEFRRTG